MIEVLDWWEQELRLGFMMNSSYQESPQMDMNRPRPIEQQTFNAQKLTEMHPPRLRNRNKRLVYSIACPPGCTHGGEVVYSRWDAMPLPVQLDLDRRQTEIESREDHYDYALTRSDSESVEWHVNFADPHLFVAYGTSLFAQDEIQAAEHPSLGSLREALLADDKAPVTVDRGYPTPILVRGVERRCAVATDPNPSEGRPDGLYGNAFARAGEDAIQCATLRIEPPTITNLIAMAAPDGGWGEYSQDEVEYVLTTAYSGFCAARLESSTGSDTMPAVVIHTGFWGCGAFGGNRVLMPILQVLAAHLAGVDAVVFHTFNPAGARALAQARDVLQEKLITSVRQPVVSDLINRIVGMSFRWGVSDGN